MSAEEELQVAKYEFSLVLETVLDVTRIRDLRMLLDRNPSLIANFLQQIKEAADG